MTRDEVVAEARQWIGTNYQDQAHTRGIGADCVGFIGGVAVELGLLPANWWETTFAPYAGYGREPRGDGLLSIIDLFMDRVDVPMAGDVVVMRFRRSPQHLGLVANYANGGQSIIHALNGGPNAVVEHRVDERWRTRIVAAYALPGVS